MASQGKPPWDREPEDEPPESEFDQAPATAYDPDLAKRFAPDAAASSEALPKDFDEDSPTRESKNVVRQLAAHEARLQSSDLQTTRSSSQHSGMFERELPTRSERPKQDQIPLPDLPVDDIPPPPAADPIPVRPPAVAAASSGRSFVWAALLGIAIGGAAVGFIAWYMTRGAHVPVPVAAPALPPAPVPPPVAPEPPPAAEPAPAAAAPAAAPAAEAAPAPEPPAAAPAPAPTPTKAKSSRSKRKTSRRTRR